MVQYGDYISVISEDEHSIEAVAYLLVQAAYALKELAKDGKAKKFLKFEIVFKENVPGFGDYIAWKATLE